MDPIITQLIYRESGGFAGLQRGCTVQPDALPEAPRGQLQSLLRQPNASAAATAPGTLTMPDMLVYTLELVSQPQSAFAEGAQADDTPTQQGSRHWLLQYPASDVPDDVTDLIAFLHSQARPLPPR
jgi:hypothetical protein